MYILVWAPVLASSPNRATEVTRSGVKPLNQAERLSSEVPVLPATFRPSRAGFSATDTFAVPSATTPVSTEVTVSAALRLMTCSPIGSGIRVSVPPCSADLMMVGVTCLPWLSSVA